MRVLFLSIVGASVLFLSACGNNCNTYPNYTDASCPNYVNPNMYGNNPYAQPYGGYPQGGGYYPPTNQPPYGGYPTSYPQQPCAPNNPYCRH